MISNFHLSPCRTVVKMRKYNSSTAIFQRKVAGFAQENGNVLAQESSALKTNLCGTGANNGTNLVPQIKQGVLFVGRSDNFLVLNKSSCIYSRNDETELFDNTRNVLNKSINSGWRRRNFFDRSIFNKKH